MDGRDHIRQRRLISAGFTPRMVGRLEAQTREWAVSIVEQARERGTCDFVQDVAYQLPMHMIADIVGIPLDDREWLFGLTKEMLAGGDSANIASPEAVRRDPGADVRVRAGARAAQASEPQDDVWTLLSTVEVETDDGERTALGEIELDMFFFLLTVAGSETTRNAIAGGLIALLDHPEQLARLRPDPDSDAPRGRRDPALDVTRRLLRRAAPPERRRSAASRSPKETASPCGTRRRIGTTTRSMTRSDSTSHVRRTTTSPSVAAGRTSASARTSPATRSRSSSKSCSPAPPTSRSSGRRRYSGLTIDNPVLGAVRELPVRLS